MHFLYAQLIIRNDVRTACGRRHILIDRARRRLFMCGSRSARPVHGGFHPVCQLLQLAPLTRSDVEHTNSKFERACAVNQSQMSSTALIATFAQGPLAQSFIPTLSMSCGAGFSITGSSAGCMLTIKLFKDKPVGPGSDNAVALPLAALSPFLASSSRSCGRQ